MASSIRADQAAVDDSDADEQRKLIAHVRSALALKTLPLATKHTGTADGSGLPCTVCELQVEEKDVECRIGSWGRAHTVCYLIWTVESRRLIYGADGNNKTA